MEYTVKLYRDSLESPWGFRLQGGADLKSTLSIQRVSDVATHRSHLHSSQEGPGMISGKFN